MSAGLAQVRTGVAFEFGGKTLIVAVAVTDV